MDRCVLLSSCDSEVAVCESTVPGVLQREWMRLLVWTAMRGVVRCHSWDGVLLARRLRSRPGGARIRGLREGVPFGAGSVLARVAVCRFLWSSERCCYDRLCRQWLLERGATTHCGAIRRRRGRAKRGGHVRLRQCRRWWWRRRWRWWWWRRRRRRWRRQRRCRRKRCWWRWGWRRRCCSRCYADFEGCVAESNYDGVRITVRRVQQWE